MFYIDYLYVNTDKDEDDDIAVTNFIITLSQLKLISSSFLFRSFFGP